MINYDPLQPPPPKKKNKDDKQRLGEVRIVNYYSVTLGYYSYRIICSLNEDVCMLKKKIQEFCL